MYFIKKKYYYCHCDWVTNLENVTIIHLAHYQQLPSDDGAHELVT